MPALTQWNNRTTRRDNFNSETTKPSLHDIRRSTAVVRENWSQGERQLRARLAQLLQQQLLDRIGPVPLDSTCEEKSLAAG